MLNQKEFQLFQDLRLAANNQFARLAQSDVLICEKLGKELQELKSREKIASQILLKRGIIKTQAAIPETCFFVFQATPAEIARAFYRSGGDYYLTPDKSLIFIFYQERFLTKVPSALKYEIKNRREISLPDLLPI